MAKLTKKQIKFIDALILILRYFKASNDIDSPTVYTNISDVFEEFDEKTEEFSNNAIRSILSFIKKIK